MRTMVWQLVWKNFTLYFLLLLPGAIKEEIPPAQELPEDDLSCAERTES